MYGFCDSPVAERLGLGMQSPVCGWFVLSYINTELYLHTPSTVTSLSDSMILWMPLSSHSSSDLPNFSLYFFWHLEIMHIHGLNWAVALRVWVEEEAAQHGCWSVSTDVKHFRVFFLNQERDAIVTLSDCCFLSLGPPGGSSKLPGFSKDSPAKYIYHTLAKWVHHSPILTLTKIFEDVLMKAVLSLFSVAYALWESTL